jgi:transcriptional regulator with XRE-family HTH domain
MTNKLALPELREQATALRLEGKSLREIKQITGVSSNSRLSEALRGVPPAPWTRRPRAKDHLHATARALRARGYTYMEIAAELGVSKSSVSLWTRDMPRVGRISYDEFRKRNAEGVSAFWSTESPRREARRLAITEKAASQVGRLSDREVLIAGAIAYWCEGTKNKPYRRPDNRVIFVNSDPKLILLFLRFLAVAGVQRDRVFCRVAIHESADVAAAYRFWQQVTRLPEDQFQSPTLKRHNPKTVRKNIGDDYHGCLVIHVRRGLELYRQIEGWASAAMAASTTASNRQMLQQLPGEDSNLNFAPREGFEPSSLESKSNVLPLDDLGRSGT